MDDNSKSTCQSYLPTDSFVKASRVRSDTDNRVGFVVDSCVMVKFLSIF